MAKSSSDQMLAELHTLRGAQATPQSTQVLTKALTSKAGLVAAKAAEVIAELRIESLVTELERTFLRIIEQGPASDKGCLAKTAIVKALHALDTSSEPVFVPGARYVQMEPAWGGSVDVAAELRGVCAMGLAQMGHRDTLLICSELLADPEAQVRQMAARAIAATGREEGAMLLRLKALLGDKAPEITGECLQSLGMLAPGKSIEFLGKFLDSPDPTVACSAALALGETHRADALDRLRDAWPAWSRSPDRSVMLQSIALLRLPQAVEFLLQAITDEPDNVASEAVEALQLYRSDSAMRTRVETVVNKRKSAALRRAFDKSFG